MPEQVQFQRFSDAIVNALILRFIPVSVKPNTVTGIRLTMTPIVLWFVLKEYFLMAIVLFCIASLTDWVDGAMARTRDQITALGKVLDPIADKLLIVSLMTPLVARHLTPLLAIVIVVLEVIFVLNGYYRSKHHQRVLQANWWGKIKFSFQVLGTLLLMLFLQQSAPILLPLSLAAYSIAIGFGVVSLVTKGF